MASKRACPICGEPTTRDTNGKYKCDNGDCFVSFVRYDRHGEIVKIVKVAVL